MSQTNANTHSPTGKVTNIGWIGCRKILAGALMSSLLAGQPRITRTAWSARTRSRRHRISMKCQQATFRLLIVRHVLDQAPWV